MLDAGKLGILVGHLALCTLLSCAPATASNDVLTNQTIIEMAKIHLSDANIIDLINDSKCSFTVTASAIISLKGQGVSNDVIAAMTAKMRGSSGGARVSATPPNSPTRPTDATAGIDNLPNEQWVLPPSMSATSREAILKDTPFLIAAACNSGGLTFQIRYLKNFGFAIEQNSSNDRPYIPIDLSIDGKLRYRMFGILGDNTNEVSLIAQSQAAVEDFDVRSNLARAIGVDVGVVLSIPEVYNAHTVKMVFPLQNGQSAAWEFEPHSAQFREFGSSCNSILPKLGFSLPAPTPDGGSPATTTPSIQDNDIGDSKLLDDLVRKNSQSWLLNRYVSGSMSARIESRDGQGRPQKIQGKYIFEGMNGRTEGTVALEFSNGVPACLYFWDYPKTCRVPDASILEAYSRGAYEVR